MATWPSLRLVSAARDPVFKTKQVHPKKCAPVQVQLFQGLGTGNGEQSCSLSSWLEIWVCSAIGQIRQVCPQCSALPGSPTIVPTGTGTGTAAALSESLDFWSYISASQTESLKGSQHVGFDAHTPPSRHRVGPGA